MAYVQINPKKRGERKKYTPTPAPEINKCKMRF
jgi:hypothetical protein